jgi:hypothetical protein
MGIAKTKTMAQKRAIWAFTPLKLVQTSDQLVRKFDVLMDSIHIYCEV